MVDNLKTTCIRLEENQYKDLKNFSERRNISLASAIREIINLYFDSGKIDVVFSQKEEKSKIDSESIDKIYEIVGGLCDIKNQYVRIGNNINQISHKLNSGYDLNNSDIKFMMKNMEELTKYNLVVSKMMDDIGLQIVDLKNHQIPFH